MVNKNDYEIKKSTRKNKKYQARLKGSNDKWIHFGSLIPEMEHYKDTTPLKLYSYLDHKNKQRKINFRNRFKKRLNDIGSATWLSNVFLWT